MGALAITAIGDDRPGIVAAVTEVLAAVDANLEDTSMTILRGHFAMMLIVGCDRPAAEVEAAVAPVAADLDLVVSVREVSTVPPAAAAGAHYVVMVHGADRPGIVARISRVIASAPMTDRAQPACADGVGTGAGGSGSCGSVRGSSSGAAGSAASWKSRRGFCSEPSETTSRLKNSASVQSATTRAFRFNVGTRLRWYVRCMNQAGRPLSFTPYTWATPLCSPRLATEPA